MSQQSAKEILRQLPIASYLTEAVLSWAEDKVVLWPIIGRLAYLDFSLPYLHFYVLDLSLIQYHRINTSIREEKRGFDIPNKAPQSQDPKDQNPCLSKGKPQEKSSKIHPV
jgi:hypothetical protein